MKESTLLRVSLVSSLVGLVLLYALSYSVGADGLPSFDNAEEDDVVKLTGTVSAVDSRGSVTVVDVAYQKQVEVVVFGSRVNLSPGEKVDIFGRLSSENGEKELIGDEIRVVE